MNQNFSPIDQLLIILRPKVLAELQKGEPLTRRELIDRLSAAQIDFGALADFANEPLTHSNKNDVRWTNQAGWAITGLQMMGIVRKNGGRGGSYELTETAAEFIALSPEEQQERHKSLNKQLQSEKRSVAPPKTPIPQMYFSDVYPDFMGALESLNKIQRMIVDNGYAIDKSGIHYLPNNQFVAWQIYTN